MLNQLYISIITLAVISQFIGCINTDNDTAGGGSVIENTEIACSDGIDNDGNGFFDCLDQDCFQLTVCDTSDIIADISSMSIEEDTHSSSSNRMSTNDSQTPNDSSPQNESSSNIEPSNNYSSIRVNNTDIKENTLLTCSDNIDNDNDSFIDCDDSDCEDVSACIPEAVCDDMLDNDRDGMMDCDDRDCHYNIVCQAPTENTILFCTDDIDNDSDGLKDCEDPDCSSFSRCALNTLPCYEHEAFPASWDIPITIYDFPDTSPILGNNGGGSDGCPNAITYGMVESQLGANGTPTSLSGACSSSNINQWWTGAAALETYESTLSFTNAGGSVYSYATHAQGFFPVPGSCAEGTGGNTQLECRECVNGVIPGVGTSCTESAQRNYGFTVHFRLGFIYIPESAKEHNFFFSGDDDVFVFLNSHLALDIGGRHEPQAGSFNIWQTIEEINQEFPDQVITAGDSAYIDFFIAERAPGGSQAIITLNKPCNSAF